MYVYAIAMDRQWAYHASSEPETSVALVHIWRKQSLTFQCQVRQPSLAQSEDVCFCVSEGRWSGHKNLKHKMNRIS